METVREKAQKLLSTGRESAESFDIIKELVAENERMEVETLVQMHQFVDKAMQDNSKQKALDDWKQAALDVLSVKDLRRLSTRVAYVRGKRDSK